MITRRPSSRAAWTMYRLRLLAVILHGLAGVVTFILVLLTATTM
ncbi:hypothetical protein [Sphaerisporangium flaviroseum]